MSDFATKGFEPFPDSYHDNLHVRDFSALSPEALDFKTDEYGAFMQRTDLMPRARLAGERILNHLLFELAWQDGIYDEYITERLEDAACE